MSQTKVEAPFVANNANFRNLIINGDINISQRGTSASSVTASQYLCDRWEYETIGEETVTISQVADAPDNSGLNKSFKVEVTTADSDVIASDYAVIKQVIEAQNLQHLEYGTSDAKKITISFNVKSSVTGTYAVGLEHGETTSYQGQTYTISSANTWESKTLTFVGNTATAINNDNGGGLHVNFFLTAGTSYTTGSNGAWGAATNWAANHAANIIGTVNSTFFITGVQVEVGETATDFEHLPHDVQLQRCQRYFTKFGGDDAFSPFGSGMWKTGTVASLILTFPTKMNHEPTMTIANATATHLRQAGTAPNTSAIALDVSSTLACMYNATVSSGGSAGEGTVHFGDSTTNCTFSFDSEL
jgi:hypothetical protein